MQNKQFKTFFLFIALISLTLEFHLTFYYYRKIYDMEFLMLNLLYLSVFFISTLLVIYKTKYYNDKLFKYFFNSNFVLIFAIVFFKGYTNRKELDKYGVETFGIVTEKHRVKIGYRINSEFVFKNIKYNSELDIDMKNEFEKIKIGDTMKIKFLIDFPKNNKGIRMIKKSIH